MLVDVHCHLDELADVEEAVEEAKAKGVGLMVSSSVDLASMRKNLVLSQNYPEVKCCLGLHPSNLLSMQSSQIEEALAFLEENIGRCLAVGETGLDFKYAETGRQKMLQKEVFERQVSLALANGKAVVVHSRQAREEVLKLLEAKQTGKALLHWFMAKNNLMKRAVENGFFISVGPSLLFEPGLEKMVESLPLENLLLETDCPVRFSGQPARPAWVKEIALKVSSIKGISLDELERKTWGNARQIFPDLG